MIKYYNLKSTIVVKAPIEYVWENITEVNIAKFPHPLFLTIIGIPRPLRAKIEGRYVGGLRIAYFDNNRRFIQEVTVWNPPRIFSFTFKADADFRVGYLFDLFDGPFKMLSGSYQLKNLNGNVQISLESRYHVSGIWRYILSIPIRLVLILFKSHLLSGIKKNCEAVNGT